MNTHDKFELPPPAGHYYEWGDGCGKRKAYYTEDQVVAAIEPYKDEIARLQRIIDSRPAINAGLPQTYIEWSHSIYQMEAACVLEVKQ